MQDKPENYCTYISAGSFFTFHFFVRFYRTKVYTRRMQNADELLLK